MWTSLGGPITQLTAIIILAVIIIQPTSLLFMTSRVQGHKSDPNQFTQGCNLKLAWVMQ